MKKFRDILTNEDVLIWVFIAYFLTFVLSQTMIAVDFSIVMKLLKYMRYVTVLFFALSAAVYFVDFAKDKRWSSFTWKEWGISALLVVLAVALLLNYKVTHDKKLIMSLIAAWSVSRADFDQLIRKFSVTQILTVVIVLSMCSFGLIENYLATRGDGSVRSAMGFDFVTRAPAILTFGLLYYCCIRKFRLKPLEIVLLQFVGTLIYFAGDTATYFILNEGLVGISILRLEKFRSATNKMFGWLEYIFVYLFPLMPLIPLLLSLFYRKGGFFYTLNNVTHNRISLMYGNIINHGFSLFGKSFKMYGYGAADYDFTNKYGTNYIDSGFMQIMLIRGLVIFVILIVLLAIVLRLMYAKERHFDILIVLVFSLASILTAGFVSSSSLVYVLMFAGIRSLLQLRKAGDVYA